MVWIALIVIVGSALRLLPFFAVPDSPTLDEYLYMTNVTMLHKVGGPLEYHALIEYYVEAQEKEHMVMLPPTRCVYIMLGWAATTLFQVKPETGLRGVAMTFSILNFLLAGAFAYRLAGPKRALVVLALMAAAPLELMLGRRELVDGVFAFWALLALWLLWENMQKPGRLGWLAAYSAALTVMVLTKENAFFAAVGIGGVIAVAAIFPSLKMGRVTWSTVIATVAGGALGIAVLICLAGSPQMLYRTFHLLVTKAEGMEFAQATGRGPWYRYLIDLMLLSPLVVILAIGGIFGLKREDSHAWFLLLFVLFSGFVMVHVENGMNVRYTAMWGMPMRFFAAGALLSLAAAVPRRALWQGVVLGGLLGLVCSVELHQYWLFFMWHDIGEPVTKYLMYATEIVKYGTKF
jgi:4-amino-4-deoxy-L-arabinose transferase-like glycosyltransferase